MKPNTLTLVVFALLTYFAVSPMARAVVPPPDGGYPNFTTAEGQNALLNLTTGAANTAVGWFSLFSNTEGSFNTATGAGSLLFNTADGNTAFGTAALLFNTTGSNNTAVGASALLNNNPVSGDTVNGGAGSNNTAVGAGALSSNTVGGLNTAVGDSALRQNTGGFLNTAVGSSALSFNTTGPNNTAVGASALLNNTSGEGNTANGLDALRFNTIGQQNTAVGDSALFNNTTGNLNTALGDGAGIGVTTASNVIAIGHPGANVNDSCYISNIFGATSSGGVAVFINSDGKLGTNVSSRRFKEEIKPMQQASEALFALRPVMFHYKKEIDPVGTSQFGLVAEEVAEVNPDLVVRDAHGEIYSVRYDQINAMLLNEFLKEHRKVEKLEANDAEQQKEIKALVATVKEQAAQIQKVSAQLELNKPAPRTVKTTTKVRFREVLGNNRQQTKQSRMEFGLGLSY